MNKYSLYLNQDLDFDKNKDLIESSINSLPINEESKHYLVSKVADTKNINKLQDKVDECNEIIDQLSSNPGSYLDLDSGKVITPSDLADELRDRENTINELQDKLNKAKDSESRSELESELNENKERRKEVIEKVTRTVNEGLNKIVGTSKDLLSGDPDKVLNAITDSFFGILGLLTKGLVKLVSKGIDLNEKRKLNELTQKDKDEVNKIKLDPKVESTQNKVDNKWLTENNIQNKINMARSEELFKNVDKITDWKSAFDYGYAKLKQVFGDKFDKKIADATLNGLKEKYPNNPMVVVGALKYGHHSDEDKNSRAVNSRVTDIASKYVGKLNNSNFREIFKSIAIDFGFSNISIPSHIETLSDFMWYGGFDESIPDDVFMAMELLCEYYGSDVNLNSRQSDDRQKVDPKTLELAKSDGVVQKKPNGKWGIISLKSGEWWTADYQSEDSARNALKAYHARKGNSINFNSKFTNSKESKEVYFPDKMPEKVRVRLNYWKDLDNKINELLGTSKSQLSLDIPYFEGRKLVSEDKRDLFDKKSGIMGFWLFALNLDGINGTVFNCLRKSGLGEYKRDHLYGSNYLEMYQIPLTKGVELYEYLKSNLGRCNSRRFNANPNRGRFFDSFWIASYSEINLDNFGVPGLEYAGPYPTIDECIEKLKSMGLDKYLDTEVINSKGTLNKITIVSTKDLKSLILKYMSDSKGNRPSVSEDSIEKMSTSLTEIRSNISNSRKVNSELTYKPKSNEELKKFIKDYCSKNGWDSDLNFIDVSNVTDMYAMFSDSNFNGDISDWDVSKVTDMGSMFFNSKFNGDISKWNVSKVRNMTDMFCQSNFNGDISDWDVSKVTSMYGTFRLSKFNGDISKWNVSKVTDMALMFYGSSFNGDISDWDVSKVTNMSKMFSYSQFTGDISKWNVRNVTKMNSMFFNSKFNGDISKWNVSKVTDMEEMFSGCDFNGDISNWKVSKVKNMAYMFHLSQFTGDISKWKVSNGTNMYGMFKGSDCPIPSWYRGTNSRVHKVNSVIPSSDMVVADKYIAKANNDNYLEILRKIAREVGEPFLIHKSFPGDPTGFRNWVATNYRVSDRMFIIIDYVLGAVTGMKLGVR